MQANPNTQLPQPDAESAEHSRRVADYLRRKIEVSDGSISFAEFMHDALYAPGLGYYVAGNTKFGAHGDFITAPELSPIFAAVLARQCAEVWPELPGSSLLELGAGSGVLAATLLKSLARRGALPDRYLILEVSPELRQRQERLLAAEVPDLMKSIQWLDNLPEAFSGVILANEVADAIPVELFKMSADRILQRRVTLADGGFSWCSAAAPHLLEVAVRQIEAGLGRTLPDGYSSEVSLALPQWIADIARILQHGILFLMDYGLSRTQYYAPDRQDGWLRAHFRHFAHSDPLVNVGIQDLTSWVDFTAVATAAADSGLSVDGYVTQAQFLMNGGLQEELLGFTDLDPEQQIKLSQQVKLLTLPGEMGENFKCIGLGRGRLALPSAFNAGDRAHTL